MYFKALKNGNFGIKKKKKTICGISNSPLIKPLLTITVVFLYNNEFLHKWR